MTFDQLRAQQKLAWALMIQWRARAGGEQNQRATQFLDRYLKRREWDAVTRRLESQT